MFGKSGYAVMGRYFGIIPIALLLCCLEICYAELLIRVETAEMTSVGSILTNIPQELKWPRTQGRTYKVISGQEYAEVTKNTGILKVKKQMDREKLCVGNTEHCKVDIQVAALAGRQGGGLKMVKIQIEVLDINDNAPVFENTVITKTMSEAVDVGTSIRLDSAVDPDYGSNSIQDYQLVASSGSQALDKYFELEIITNIDGTKIPKLKLRRPLDRERKGVHRLMLAAVDGGEPPLTGTATVLINITDSNDNVPEFAQDVYVVKVNEHTKPGTKIIQVVATDEDTGPNGMIVYKFPSVVNAEDREIFVLDSHTGKISIKNSTKLDFEKKKIHHLSVEATDMGPNAVSAYVTVTVKVLDVNDNKPVFDVNFMQSKLVKDPPENSRYDQTIMENIDKGRVIAFVTITDKDGGDNGTVECQLQDNKVFDLEKIADTNGGYLLKINSLLDREKKESYDLNINAWDKGVPPQSSTKTLHFQVGDINDNAPKFSYGELEVRVSETAKKGDIVMTLKATDKDEKPGPNSKIAFTFLSGGHIVKDNRNIRLTDIFKVNAATGDVTLAIEDVLDAEEERSPGFITAMAEDHGNPPRNTTTKLNIKVVDENDNAPIFDKESYIFRIDEHVREGKFVGEVHAKDADFTTDTNGKVSYSVEKFESKDRTISQKDQDLWMKMFQVETTTGFIHFFGNSTKLDREIYSEKPITITVVATDNGMVRRKAKATVEIYLADINDNEPLVLFPDGRQDVGFVKIIPADNIDSNAVSDPSQALRNGPTQTWASIVSVQEGLNSSLGGVSSISLSQVRATDKDKGDNAILGFTISAGNDDHYFDVNTKDGNVTFSRNVDINTIKLGCHILKIRVGDHGIPALGTDAYVNLYLSKKDYTEVNVTDAMRECKQNPLFPKIDDSNVGIAGFTGMTMYLIIGFGVLIFIILLIIVIVLIKCFCCDKHKKSRSYNCQQGNSWNASSGYDADSKKNLRKKGSSRRSYNGQGTVDSRSSFHSEWTASQTQIALDKADKVRVLPDLPSVGSAESRNAHDSGTGDSVSGDPYHQNNYNDIPEGPNYLPPHDTHYIQSHQNLSPMKYATGQVVDLPPSHMLTYSDHPNMYPRAMISPKCTNECLLYGHGDHCWMPDSLLRSQAQGPIDMMAGGNPDRVVYQNHPDSHGLRYQGDASTPYYYDPGKKFSHLSSTEGSDQLSYSKGHDDGYRHPVEGIPTHQGYPLSAIHAPSPHPHQRMFQNDAERERAYINLQGYDAPQNQGEEMHSNLSSASSNTNPYGAALPQNHPRLPNHPQMFYQVATMQNPRYDMMATPQGYMPGMHESGTLPMQYKEDYSASNLLPTIPNMPTDYNQHWDHAMPVSVEQQPLINRSDYPQSRSGRTSNPVLDEKERLLPPNYQETVSPPAVEMDPASQQNEPKDDKLTTIQESEADPNDGLLL